MSVRVLLLLFLTVMGFAAESIAGPKFSADQLNYDFGEIIQGKRVDYVFRFRNAGDQILQLGSLRSSCGCTVALLSATRLAPGDLGEVRVTFDSTRFRGAISKTVSLDTNDPNFPQISFNMFGTVKAEISYEPDRINWGKVKAGTALRAVVKIVNQGTHSVKLVPAQATDPAVTAKLSSLLLQPKGQVELIIEAKFPEQKKRLGGYVIIGTDYQKVPQLRVPVSARLLP